MTDTGRGPALQDVPTFTEQGDKFDVNAGTACVPAKTQAAIVERLNQQIDRILSMDETQKKSAALNMPKPPIKAAEPFGATVLSDIATWQAWAKKAKLKNELGGCGAAAMGCSRPGADLGVRLLSVGLKSTVVRAFKGDGEVLRQWGETFPRWPTLRTCHSMSI